MGVRFATSDCYSIAMSLTDKEFAQEVNRLRHRKADELSFLPPLECLLDEEHSRAVFDHIRDNTCHWEQYLATPRLGRSLPKSPGVYMFVWRPAVRFDFSTDAHDLTWILYVGATGGTSGATIRRRYDEYKRYVAGCPRQLWDNTVPLDRRKRLTKFLSLRPLYFWCIALDDRAAIEDTERALIKLLNPPLNVQHASIRATPGNPEPAWRQ